MKIFNILLTIVFFMLFCPFIYGQEKLPNEVKFIQGNNTYTITNVIDSVIIERKPFSIRYFCDDYDSLTQIIAVTQIAVLDNPVYLEDLYIGMPIDDVPFFHGGTGMAAGETGYDNLFITNSGHHYLYYESETDKRSELISKKKGKMELEWKIYNAHYKGEEVEFTDLKLACVYFVIVADNNDDGKIQMDELKIIRVTFNGEARN